MQVGNTRVTMDPICSVGEVRVADDADFAKIKLLCQCHEGWKQEFNKSGTTVWTRANEVSDFNMIKVILLINGYCLKSQGHQQYLSVRDSPDEVNNSNSSL